MKNSILKYQFIITLMILLLGFSGIITIAIGCSQAAKPLDLVWKQLLRLLISSALIWGIANIRFERLKRVFPWCAAVSLVLLYTLLKFGSKINGMRGWFRYEAISLQPSEPGKAFFLAGFVLLMTNNRVRKLPEILKIAVCGAYTALWMAAVLLQPDMGTSAVYAATFLALLYFGNVKLRSLAAVASAFAACAILFILKHPYAMRRIDGFLNPELDPLGRGWHLRQLLRAISRGSWFGVKSVNATWSKSYLPFAYNDSAFATISETVGMVGASIIPLAFLAVGIILIRLAEDIKHDEAAQLYVKGAAFMIVFQSFLHISVNIGLLPVTGITMVFISYGGSSMLSGALLTGIAFSALNSTQTTNNDQTR